MANFRVRNNQFIPVVICVMRPRFGQIKYKKPSQMCLQTPVHPAPCTEYQHMCCVDYFYNYVSVPTGSSVIIYMKV